ncbi:hypothetical protein [Micromonospora foliorum]|uniref:hypothetical protein n=1 Tax=Micromonospora foliorum TaxID=2911210 RepID=UPI001EE91CE1|nr:hypothetical protein [Micromonospora foliorum]MCG5434682.1 hypothetical protein [Micromonospora foliorum]
MSADALPAVPFEVVARRPPLDYYLVLKRRGGSASTETVDGIVVEEFARQQDFSARGLDSAGWTPGADWWSSASLSRGMRTNPELLVRVVPTTRAEAESVYHRLGGGRLPDEAVLRTYFLDHQPIAATPPLRLGPAQPPADFHERRVYRVLFARDLRAEQVANLQALWRTPVDGTNAAAASGHLDKNGDHITWDLRRVGGTLAWCLDVTVLMRTDCAEAVGSALSDLTAVLRQHGLIPVTTERFA